MGGFLAEARQFQYVGPEPVALIGHGELVNGDVFTPDPDLIPGLLEHPHFKTVRVGKKGAIPESTNDEPEEAFATH